MTVSTSSLTSSNRDSKVYLSKRIGPEVLQTHQSKRNVVQAL